MDIYNSQPSHGGMFMRSHPPSGLKHMNPVVFLHTDHHSGEYWDTKPDGDPGWVSVFNNEGFMVYAPDLPFCGKSKGFGSAMVALGLPAMRFTPQFAEAMLTAPERINHFHWMGVEHHTQWPGTGLRGDPCFEAYFRKTEVKMLGDQERQTRAQHSLVDFLNTLEHPAILVGHGSGANLAYLAADRAPERVAAIVALEPIGPPFANALRNSSRSDGTKLEYTSEYVSIPTNQPGVRCRPYGVSDIPLQFDPPPLPPTTMEDILDEGSRYQPIPFVEVFDQKAKQFCYLQDESVHPPRKLTNLQKIPNCIFTAGSSSHSAYDWATVAFLKQAGVPVQHLELAVKNGNGPLFFLEKNSSKLALSLINWLRGNILSRPSLGLLNPPPSTGAAQNSSDMASKRFTTKGGTTQHSSTQVASLTSGATAGTTLRPCDSSLLVNNITGEPFELPKTAPHRSLPSTLSTLAPSPMEFATKFRSPEQEVTAFPGPSLSSGKSHSQYKSRSPTYSESVDLNSQERLVSNAAPRPVDTNIPKRTASVTPKQIRAKRGPYKKTLERRAAVAALKSGTPSVGTSSSSSSTDPSNPMVEPGDEGVKGNLISESSASMARNMSPGSPQVLSNGARSGERCLS